jgi:hypothetical protein
MTDDLDLLRALRADQALPPSPAARAAARRALDDRIGRARPARARGRRPLMAFGLAVATAGAAAIAITTGVDSGRVAPAPAGAREALARAAQAAEHAGGYSVPRDDQYFYVHSEGRNLSTAVAKGGSYSLLERHDRRVWLSVGHDSILHGHIVGAPEFLTPKDRSEAQRIGGLSQNGGNVPESLGRQRWWVGSREFNGAELRAYDPSPKGLYDDLLAHVGSAGSSPTAEVFVLITDALREQPATPALRATFFRALAYVPGLEFGGATKDRMGRAGVAITYTENQTRHELIFDPDTSQVLSERDVIVKPFAGVRAKAGQVIGDVVYLERKVVDTAPTQGLTAP